MSAANAMVSGTSTMAFVPKTLVDVIKTMVAMANP
jgi:hypothetical protein